jgi:hypothetical protein
VIAAWAFHAGVVLVMNVWFPYALFGLAFAPLLPVERLAGILKRRARLPTS